jgi:hypothetical protein
MWKYFPVIQPPINPEQSMGESECRNCCTGSGKGILMSVSHSHWKVYPIRVRMAAYRRAQGDYYLKGKKVVTLENGSRVFSLLAPALGSPASRRRIRQVIDNMSALDGVTSRGKDHASPARTPSVTSETSLSAIYGNP